MLSIKKKLYLFATLLFLGNKVKANDCSIVERIISNLGSNYNVNNCCEYNGVFCDKKMNVIGLHFNDITNPNLNTAKIFEDITTLKSLISLELVNANLKIDFPKSLCNLTNLKDLNLSNNDISGTIPYDCKNLQNLEQLNLEGNVNLNGYVPILSKLKGCSYKSTGLCNLTNAKCKNAPRDCSVDDIKNTNGANGYPDPNSDSYEGATADREINYNENNQYGYDYQYGSDNQYMGNQYGYNNQNDYNYGYENSNYGYNSYDNSAYGYETGNSGYNGYDNNYYGYGYNNGNNNLYEDNYNSPFNSLLIAMLSVIAFGIILFSCCAYCVCRGCCSSTVNYSPTPSNKPVYNENTIKPYTGIDEHQNIYIHDDKPYGQQSIESDVTSSYPFNVSSLNGYSGFSSQPNSGFSGYPNSGYNGPFSPQMNQVNYGNGNPPYGYGGNRSIETEDVVDNKGKNEEQ